MKKILYIILVTFSMIGISNTLMYAQMDQLHGTDDEYRMGVHAGNQFRTTIFNDGTFGGHPTRPGEIGGEWPINSGHLYMLDGNLFVGSELIDTAGLLKHVFSTVKSAVISQSTGDQDPVTGEWWTFLPLPGFANPKSDKIAMAKGSNEWEDSWPSYWPDKYEDGTDPGWRNNELDNDDTKAAWNGYFGKNVFNADEESFFVSDDYNNREFNFFPDANDLDRRGLGMRMYVRGFQWAKSSVEDALFCLFDLENVGTHLHDKMVFGYKIGNNMGDTFNNGDGNDDAGAYDKDLDLAYLYDQDDIGASDWGTDPVGFFGGAFLESPGNPFDGIDNDNDGFNGTGGNISTSMFEEKTLNLSSQIIVTNYTTLKRTVTTLGDTLSKSGKDTLEIFYQDLVFKFWDGMVMQEVSDNLVDDNLNGLIDENRGQEDNFGVFHYLYIDNGVGYKCIDYFDSDPNTNGLNNPLIDEKRDDGIDNDGDWDPLQDDKGEDGLAPGDPDYPGPDFGEGDGVPTSGEPHFDKTDIDESDMIGLTSFYMYEWPDIPHYDDEAVWAGMEPGLFNYSTNPSNIELMYGSGYFPMLPGQIERFSMGLIAGITLEDIIRNKGYVAEAYNQNYNFAKAPYIPTVKAVAGDNKVTLFWDDVAESSVDPISGEDFEGYKIYRSTDPAFSENAPITDGYGTSTANPLFRKPMAQFDLDNEYSGFALIPTSGVQYYLGDNTGIKHFWVDTTAVNGFDYYYAVTSYDHGDIVRGIDPSECTKFIAVSADGTIDKGTNVVITRPEAPAAGFVPADIVDGSFIPSSTNTTSATIDYQIIRADEIKNENRYSVTFTDTLSELGYDSTQSFTLVNLTSSDTLYKNSPLFYDEDMPTTEGFQLSFNSNPIELNLNVDSSGWNNPGLNDFTFRAYSYRDQPIDLRPYDYEIIFAEVGVGNSKSYMRGATEFPAIPVNFTVINTVTNETVDFAFRERDVSPGEEGIFSFNQTRQQSDEIILLANADSNIASWQIVMVKSDNLADTTMPGPGDVLTLRLDKPFLSHDSFEFVTKGFSLDKELAKSDLNKIKVVPNPYIVTNSWEPKNPYSNGRGDRELHFTHLPPKCTIRIFNVRGQLVNTIYHDEAITDGTEIWNMLSKDNLEISYGIYVYHIEAEGIGERIGKFLIIK